MPVYCLDTSALLDGWNRHYPVDVVPTMWERLSDLAATGTIVCPDEVLREVLKKDDSLSKWVKGVKGLIVPLDTAQQIAVAEILAEFPRLVDTRKNRSIADPFVIALARVRNATVVTGEKAAGTADKPKIPNVCLHYGVPTTSLLGFIREMKWTLQLSPG